MRCFKLIIIVLLLITIPKDCFASTNTFTRTKNNLLVPERTIYTAKDIEKILRTPAVSPAEKIYDYADLYSNDEEKMLFQKINEYINNSKIDLAIVTTKELNGFTLSDYAYNFYDYNNFEKEGVVFVIFAGSDKPSLFMGNIGDSEGRVFSLYSEKRINQTLEYIYSDIKVDNYYVATDNYIKILNGFYNLNRSGNYRLDKNGTIVKSIPWFELIILAGTMTIIITILFVYKLGVKKDDVVYGWDSNINEATMMVKFINDDLIGTYRNKK